MDHLNSKENTASPSGFALELVLKERSRGFPFISANNVEKLSSLKLKPRNSALEPASDYPNEYPVFISAWDAEKNSNPSPEELKNSVRCDARDSAMAPSKRNPSESTPPP